MEAAGFHGGDGLGVFHEGVPDEGGAEILCHEDADAQVDAEHVGVVPLKVGMEGVAKSVASPGVVTEVGAERPEDADAVGR